METTENNKLIAEFMGYETYEHTGSVVIRLEENNGFSDTFGHVHTKYHLSWDWLMPVVEKIEAMGYPNETIGKSSTFYKGDSTTKIWNDEFIGKTKQEAICQAVVEFIKLYNENR